MITRPLLAPDRLLLAGWLGAGLLVSMAAAAVPGPADGARERENSVRRIATLSLPAKERLARNFARYKTLTRAEREQLARFHDELTADAQRGGELRQVLAQFSDFVRELSPEDRTALRNETDPIRKEQKVRQLLAARKVNTPAETTPEPPVVAGSGDSQDAQDLINRGLSATDVGLVLDVLAAHMVEHAPAEKASRLRETQGTARKLVILDIFRESLGERRPGAGPGWGDPELITDMAKAITDPAQRQLVLSQAVPSGRREVLMLMLFNGIRRDFEEHPPELEQLQSAVGRLSPAEREEFDRLSPLEQRKRLMQRFFRFRSERGPGGFPPPRERPPGGPPPDDDDVRRPPEGRPEIGPDRPRRTDRFQKGDRRTRPE